MIWRNLFGFSIWGVCEAVAAILLALGAAALNGKMDWMSLTIYGVMAVFWLLIALLIREAAPKELKERHDADAD
jgi:Fe2+ transport system protein B